MNIVKAKQILVEGIEKAYAKQEELLYHKALGYSDGYDDATKEERERVKDLMEFIRGWVRCECHPPSDYICKRCEALSAYKGEKLGE